MKICFPVESNEGLESNVYNHFGSAPLFIVVDTEEGKATEQVNKDLGHAHGRCKPLKALAGKEVDAIVVGGIGKGALTGLKQAGLKVYQALQGTVAENLASIECGGLPELTPELTCGGHGHSHGHGSHHTHGCSH